MHGFEILKIGQKIDQHPEAYSEPFQKPKMERFLKLVNKEFFGVKYFPKTLHILDL